MKNNYSLAMEKRWKKVSPAKRKKLLSDIAKKRWSKKTKKEKREHALKMLSSRYKKDYIPTTASIKNDKRIS